MLKFPILAAVSLFCVATSAVAGTLHPERWYSDLWCGLNEGARTEVVYEDRSRADCETREYAVETDFAPKYKYAIGQAMHYSTMSGKKAGILLIIEKPEHEKYYKALMRDLRKKKLYIRVWPLRVH